MRCNNSSFGAFARSNRCMALPLARDASRNVGTRSGTPPVRGEGHLQPDDAGGEQGREEENGIEPMVIKGKFNAAHGGLDAATVAPWQGGAHK
eukprot:scaffold250451_cov26-Tisochrysis_lutea.AAC.3